MNLISYIPIKSKAAAVVAFILILLTGYFLYGYFSPECMACPAGAKCPPCGTSKEQQVVLYVSVFLELIIIAKAMLLTPPEKDDTQINL